MAVNPNLFAARRLGFGLRIGEDLPVPPREWAMEQVRWIPKLDFYDQDGSSIASKFPPEAALSEYPEACVHFAEEELAEQAVQKKHARFEQDLMEEVYVKYCDTPHWGAAMATTLTAINGPSPVFERFWQFWFNHFVASANDNHIQTILGAHLLATRAAMTGSFRNMVLQAVVNPAIIYYLDNQFSIGPHSRKNHESTLNENLGRELLELYTVSPAAGYAQQDVIETALILTGWTFTAGPRFPESLWYQPGDKPGVKFNRDFHEPGSRTVLGKSYTPDDGKGSQLQALVADLAVHPSTAKFISTKLARAFIADDPPADSVDRIATVFIETKGDLIAVHSAVIDEVLTVGSNFTKFMKPSIWVQQSHKATGTMPTLKIPITSNPRAGLRAIYRDLGEDFSSPPQPNGWPDTEADWLSKAMLDRRVRYANLLSNAVVDIPPDLFNSYIERLGGADTVLARNIRQADTLGHAVVMLLVSPQFLRM